MKKLLNVLIIISLLIILLSSVLFFNTKFEFLPDSITSYVEEVINSMFPEDENETDIYADYVKITSVTSSPLFNHMNLLVPKDSYVPSDDEIENKYKIYSDTVLLASENVDLIIQKYELDVESAEVATYKDQFLSILKKSHPEITYDADNVITIDDVDIPVIEFSTNYEGSTIYSFIAFICVDDELVTITENSSNYYVDAYRMFGNILQSIEYF